MPIPIHAAQAQLIVNGVSYELLDVHIRQTETIGIDPSYDGRGLTIGQTRGRITSRVVIEGEVLPDLPSESWSQFGALVSRVTGPLPALPETFEVTQQLVYSDPQPLTDEQLRQRIRQASVFPFDAASFDAASSAELDEIAALHGIFREIPVKLEPKAQPIPAPEPRSVWDRLLDVPNELC